uniref:NADH-ubiquinone oxidoreductase chain 4 n=1 Tax=Typhlocybinae gen. 1 sp. 1 BY-2021a TaxID=2893157 RepID=A0A9E6XQ58_9HEMI|nr:NADH dehydrogenase subunit 4 [Typhlocybinae gen. 1 sp. 1 BY-2021a]
MMGMFLYFFFMILFYNLFSWNLFQLSLLIFMLIFFSFSSNSFFSFISYSYGVDYYSYGLIILTLLIVCLMVMSSILVKKLSYSYFFLLVNLVLCFCLLLVFSTLHILVMYFFFEFSLIPLLALIYVWGYQPERLISGLYLFFYTLFASLPFLLVLMYLFFMNMTFYFGLYFFVFDSLIIYIFMYFAFLVKLPMFMVHFWLPKAHVQAPVSGSMILAGLLLKIGGYGFIRFMNLYEFSFLCYSYVWYAFSLLGCVYVSFICLMQGDIKCLIAYSSVAHMSMCLIGLLTVVKWGIFGSYLMMISHGLCSSGLFCLANFCYERYHSRSFFINKGLINFMPSMSMIWFLFCSFNMSCPPSLNFLSEIFIINSMLMYWSNSFIIFLLISFFSACFSYFLYSYSQHGFNHTFNGYSLGFIREFLLMIVHLMPLYLIVLFFNFLY